MKCGFRCEGWAMKCGFRCEEWEMKCGIRQEGVGDDDHDGI